MADVVNSVNKKYVTISNRVTPAYERKFGVPCDLYFPVYDKYSNITKYRDMKIFAPHQSFTYKCTPDVTKTLFYIPLLIKKQAMNSAEYEFDSFYTEDEIDRPFIETTKKRELPIGTKVVVFQGESESKFFVDKKLVVTGANGHMLLRMYLSPLAKDCDCDNEADKQIESIADDEKECAPEDPSEGTTTETENTDLEIEDNTNNIFDGISDDLEMIIPED